MHRELNGACKVSYLKAAIIHELNVDAGPRRRVVQMLLRRMIVKVADRAEGAMGHGYIVLRLILAM